MRIAAYELANRVSEHIIDKGMTAVEASRFFNVSQPALEALMQRTECTDYVLKRVCAALGLTQPSYYEYVEFGVNWVSMNRQLQQIGFVPGDKNEGIGALRWTDPTGEKMISLYVSSHSKKGNARPTFNYAVSVANVMGSGYVVVASDKTYHEACNIAYLQASVLGWEAK